MSQPPPPPNQPSEPPEPPEPAPQPEPAQSSGQQPESPEPQDRPGPPEQSPQPERPEQPEGSGQQDASDRLAKQPPGGGFGPPSAAPGGGQDSPPHSPQAGRDGGQAAQPGGGFGPPAAPPTPPSAPPVPPQGRPGEPGYGYPQQPQQPQQPGPYPQQQPYPQHPPQQGYAPYPQQQPGGGYGAPAPPGPYGQQPPGWGGPPTGVLGTTPPGSGGGNGVRVALVITAVVALLFAAGGGAWLLLGNDGTPSASDTKGGGDGGDGGTGGDGGGTGGGDEEGDASGDDGGAGGGGEPIQASLVWDTPAPEVSAEDIIISAESAWVPGENLVRLMPDAVVAYSLRTGEEAWRIPVERSGGSCQASPRADDNRIALVQGRDCEVLTVIDIAAGEEVVSMPLNEDITPDQYDYPAILGDTVAVPWSIGGSGYSISGQEKLWTTQTGAACPEVAYTVVGDTFVSKTECGFSGDEGGSFRATDESGEEQWVWEFPEEYEGEAVSPKSVLSVEPLVVTAMVGEDISEQTERIFVIDDSYDTISHELDYDEERYVRPCQVNTLDDCGTAVVQDGFLFLPSLEPGGDNAVVAFELSTGQALYEVPAIGGGQITPFGTLDDGRVLAYQAAGYELEGMVVTIDPQTEEATPLMALDHEAREKEYAMMGSVFVHDNKIMWSEGTFILMNRRFYESDTPEDTNSLLVYR